MSRKSRPLSPRQSHPLCLRRGFYASDRSSYGQPNPDSTFGSLLPLVLAINALRRSSFILPMKLPAIPSIALSLVHLRCLVGALGQRSHFNWWDCAFLDSTGLQFLATTFPRSARLAGLRSVSEAACRVHDQALGRGTFHLFRLPVALEDLIEESTSDVAESFDFSVLASKESALALLREMADSRITAPVGPVQIGVEKKILTRTSISELAAHYESAFTLGIECYPYFASDLS